MIRRRRHFEDDAGINITPMLDIVFIMLIFFIVTTSFIKEKGLEVSRPSTTPPKEVEQDEGPIVVRIDGAASSSSRAASSNPRPSPPTWNVQKRKNRTRH